MSDERIMILKMLEDGKITADEAAKLLETLEKTKSDSKKKNSEKSKMQGKFFRVKITDTETGKIRANIRIPLSVISAGEKFGANFTPKVEGIGNDELMQAVRSGEVGKIIDVYDDEDGEHVQVYIE
jgi:hypothetical protein